MSTVRVTLKAVGYPEVAPNSVLVLQSLRDVGFDIVLKDMKYKDKDKILEYFSDHNLKVSFKSIRNPDIDILDDRAFVGVDTIKNKNVNTLWEAVDNLCINNQVYDRNPLDNFIPSYPQDPNSFFIVLDYGLPTQLVDSKTISIKGTHTKGSRVINARPSIKTIDVVDCTTLRIVEHFNKDLGCFVSATEDVYFNIMV